MKSVDIVRRALADSALQGQRNWTSLGDLAHVSNCSLGTAFAATRPLIEIGAVAKYQGGGLTVLDPERVVTHVAAHRSLRKDTLGSLPLGEGRAVMKDLSQYALGGTDAAAHHLGGKYTVADHGRRILYVIPDELPQRLRERLKD